MPKAERRRRGDDLIERVGLGEAADRRVGTYSGGMRRRLDLALSLVHTPRILFLDEPTTGLDPASRASMWEEVEHLARRDGVTVFLTTQYLEEADQLADRVGIIDHGLIVAEDTPAALKAEVGQASVEAVPANAEDRPRLREVLERFGPCEEPRHGREQVVAVRLAEDTSLATIVRAIDAAGIELANLQIHQPTLDDVFLAKTGRSLEGAEEHEEEDEPVGAAA